MSNRLHDLFVGAFSADRSRPCFITPDGQHVSYGDLEAGASAVAGRLVAEGVQPGDRIALQAEKSIESVMIYLGVLKAGAVFLPLNAAYTPTEVDYFIRDAEPRAFITDPPAYVTESRAFVPLVSAISRSDSDLAAIIYTSGTTGRSKGAMLTHGNLAANAIALHTAWAFTPCRSSTCTASSSRCTVLSCPAVR